jgi:hypothetical protein
VFLYAYAACIVPHQQRMNGMGLFPRRRNLKVEEDIKVQNNLESTTFFIWSYNKTSLRELY